MKGRFRSAVQGRLATTLLLTLVATLAVTACGGGEARKVEHVTRGKAFLAERNYEKARVEFRNALQIDPKDAGARALVGLSNEKLGDYREAVKSYRAAIAADASLEMPRARLARILAVAGLADEAMELIGPGLEKAPQSADLLAARALAQAQSDPSSARKDAEEAVRIDPRNADAVALLASMRWRDGERDQAIEFLESAIEASPGDVDSRVVLAQLLLMQKRSADAERQLVEVVRLDPGRIEHSYRLAQVYLAQRKVDEAIGAMRAAVESHPDNVDTRLALAQLLVEQRSFAEGEKQIVEYARAAPDNLDLQMALGRFYEANLRPDQAARVYEALVESAGDKAQGTTARSRLAAVRMRQGQADEAAMLVEQVLKRSPRDGDALATRAELAVQRGDPAAAVVDLRTALADQPDSVPLAAALARAYVRSSDTSLAEQTMRGVVQANPGDAEARFVLAQLLVELGKSGQALPVLEQLVSEQPNNPRALEALARLQLGTGDMLGAQRTADALRALQPRSTVPFMLQGAALESQKRGAEARKVYEQALVADPASVEAVIALGRLDVGDGQPDRALQRLGAALKAQPNSAGLHAARGDVLLSRSRMPDAAEAYGEAARLNPTWVQAHRSQAAAWVAAGEFERAVTVLEAGLKTTNGDPRLSFDLAALYGRLGRTDDAIGAYEALLSRSPDNAVARNNLAMALVNHRSDAHSLARAGELVATFAGSQNPALLDTHGWVMFKLGRYDEAVKSLVQAVELAPDAPEIRYHLGMAQWKASDTVAARTSLQAALAGGGRFEGIDEARKSLAALEAQ